MKYQVFLFLIIANSLQLFAQTDNITLRDGKLEEWRDLNFSQALELDRFFGPLETPRPPRSLDLINGAKVDRRLVGQNDPIFFSSAYSAKPGPAAAAALPLGATQLPPPPHHLEGFIAIPDNNTAVPPDPAGALSINHIVTILNSEIRVQDRQGRDLRTLSVERFFAPVGPFSTPLFDPRIAYDTVNKRWIIIMLSDAGGRSPAMLVAISRTEDPLGDWRITRLLNPSAVGLEFDFPRMAIGGPFLLVSVNVFRGSSYENTLNSIFNLRDLYESRSGVKQFEDFLLTNTPVEDANRENTRALFVNTAFGLFDATLRLVFRQVELVASGDVRVADRTVGVAGDVDSEYSSLILPQQGSPVLIDSGQTDLSNCVARGTDIWCAGTLHLRFGAQRTTLIQVYQINWLPGSVTPTFTRVRIDDPNFTSFYAYPSIAVNKNKDVFIGYNRFRADRFPSAHFAFRRSTDQAGSYYYDALVKAGEDSYTKGGLRVRWGDYSSTVVDPVDDLSFWTLQEYAASRTEAGTSQWGTWWLKFVQRSTACTYRLDRTSADLSHLAATVRLSLTANPPDCTRMIAPNAAWIRTQTVSAPTGSANLEFQIGLNRANTARSATINIGDQTFTVNQAANPVPPPQEAVLTVTKFDAPILARVGEAVRVSSVIRNTGTRGAGTFRIAYYMSTRTPVTNKDIFTGFGCPVNQGLLTDESTTCEGSFQVAADVAPGQYYLAAIADDREQVLMTDRSPAIRLADAGPITIQAAANAPALAAGGLVNGASARVTPLSPGLIFVLYGARLGPAALTTLTLDSDGRVATTLSGTRVFFDGVPAPLIYTSAGQISGIVPYSVSGKTSVRVDVSYNGLRSAALTLPVATAAPALFSVDFSGQNQVAALNEDGSVNSAGNPAEAGKLIVLYGTGAGTFRTQPVDGAVIGLPLPEFLQPLSLEIGGQPAELLYAGPAPGLVSGVFQINALVPEGLSGDKVSVIVRSASGSTSISSPTGAHIAVK